MIENSMISVIIPVYNPGEKNLRRCVNSVLNQTYKNIEVILIDDGSNDGSDKICDEFVCIDLRVKCFHQKNKGVSIARNIGIIHSHGDYFHFLDSDDYLELNTYENILDIINEYNCDAVTFEYFITYPKYEIVNHLDPYKYGIFFGEDIQKNLMTGMQFCSTKLLSKNLIKGLCFREDIFRGEDTLFVANALSKASRGVYFSSIPLYHYVQSEESACRGVFRENQLSVLKLYEAYNYLYWERYKNIKPYFLIFMHEVIISLYYDLWSSSSLSFKKNGLDDLFLAICKYQKDVMTSGLLSKKQKIKFRLFRVFPQLFCFIHKIIHCL